MNYFKILNLTHINLFIYIKIIKFYGHIKFINLIINYKINQYFH